MSVATIVRSWLGEVYLASCVRTPLGRMNGALSQVTPSRLGAIVIDSVLQRCAVDRVDVGRIFMETDVKAAKEMLSYAGFTDSTKYSMTVGLNGLKPVSVGIDFLSQGQNFTICGGTFMLNQRARKFINGDHNMNRGSIAPNNDIFLPEIEPIQIPGHPRLKRNPVNLIEDELQHTDTEPKPDIGAAVCLLTSKEYIHNNIMHSSPLGKISSFIESTAGHLSVASLLEANELSISDISLWQINDATFDLHHKSVKELDIDKALVNIHGGSSTPGFGGVYDLIRLVFSLKAHQKGIVVCSDEKSSLSVLIEKLPVSANFISSETKPIATLFTKDPCPLCDELKLELAPYLDQIHLDQVFLIPESYWYKLYRYEIPVLFLAGRYVCRNRFNVKLFERMLKSIQEESMLFAESNLGA